MSKLVFNRDGGKTDEFGHLLGLSRFLMGDVIDGLAVSANGSPNMTVNVATGSAGIGVGSAGTAYKYFVGLDAIESVAITTANPSNPRNDLIVMYVDVAVTASQSYTNNSNNMLKLVAVAGTPAASPADPSVANIQAAIGAANPYIILACVVVGAGVTQINSGNITDLRTLAQPVRVGASALQDNSVSTTKLVAGAVTAAKMTTPTTGDGTTTWKKITIGGFVCYIMSGFAATIAANGYGTSGSVNLPDSLTSSQVWGLISLKNGAAQMFAEIDFASSTAVRASYHSVAGATVAPSATIMLVRY